MRFWHYHGMGGKFPPLKKAVGEGVSRTNRFQRRKIQKGPAKRAPLTSSRLRFSKILKFDPCLTRSNTRIIVSYFIDNVGTKRKKKSDIFGLGVLHLLARGSPPRGGVRALRRLRFVRRRGTKKKKTDLLFCGAGMCVQCVRTTMIGNRKE